MYKFITFSLPRGVYEISVRGNSLVNDVEHKGHKKNYI